MLSRANQQMTKRIVLGEKASELNRKRSAKRFLLGKADIDGFLLQKGGKKT